MEKSLATRVIDTMYNNDPFSKWLGINRLEEGAGFCALQLTISEDMLNGFAIAHGGISYSLADSALAFASNSYGIKAVSVETSISHTKPCVLGDVLTATAKEKHLSNKIGIYDVEVTNQNNVLIALFKGTVYRTGKPWFEGE